MASLRRLKGADTDPAVVAEILSSDGAVIVEDALDPKAVSGSRSTARKAAA